MMFIQNLGARTISYVEILGNSGIFLLKTVFFKPDLLKGFSRLVKQLYFVGVLSLPIIILSALFIGMVLGLQGHIILVRFGAEQALGQLIALSLVRELSPVIGGLLFAGRAGSALTAEIGLMKATSQLTAMEMMAVDPVKRIIAPRFWAGQISMPLLSLIFSVVAIYGGAWIGVDWLGVDEGAFWSNMQSSVDFWADTKNGIVKSIVFGFAISWIALYQGFTCAPTAEGIGKSTTKTVVFSSLCILGLDFFLTAVMFKN